MYLLNRYSNSVSYTHLDVYKRQDYDQWNTNQYYELYWEARRNYRMDNGYSAEEAAAWASSNVTAVSYTHLYLFQFIHFH